MQNMYVDIPRIYTALAEWAACMLYILLLPGKLNRVKKYSLCGCMLFIQSLYLVFTARLDTFFWIPCMLGAAVLMFLFLYLEIKESVLVNCFLCAKAFLLAEFAASLEWQIHVFLFSNEVDGYRWNQMLFSIVTLTIIFMVMYLVEKNRKTEDYVENITRKECLTAIGIAVISFAISNLSFVVSDTPFTSGIQKEIFNIRTWVDLCGIAVMFVLQTQIQELFAEKELTAIHAALKTQYEQYRNYQESFEMMNMKYHDIKHQIAGLRGEPDAGKRNLWLDEMEKELDIYSEIGHTGSSVLDGILAAKSLYCKKHNIRITCVADGRLLQIIHVTHLCTIFGNALDNAIESVSMVEDEEKRLIHLSVSKQKGFIFIIFENYCEHEVLLGKDQMPVTSKSNQREHGYGMRSIRQAVEKYDGSMNFGVKNSWFELQILIPYKEQG